jgi:hypothetical protein
VVEAVVIKKTIGVEQPVLQDKRDIKLSAGQTQGWSGI